MDLFVCMGLNHILAYIVFVEENTVILHLILSYIPSYPLLPVVKFRICLQAEAAARFSDVMKRYMESLCADLRSYTITSVQSNNDRVSKKL